MAITLSARLLLPLQNCLSRIAGGLPQTSCNHNCDQGRRCTCAARSDPRCVACGQPAGKPHSSSCPFRFLARGICVSSHDNSSGD